jgi:hypothetical protein
MTHVKTDARIHPTEAELADYLGHSLTGAEKERLEEHIAACGECLDRIVSAHESVEEFRKKGGPSEGKGGLMKRINVYLLLAITSFVLSFAMPRYFLQFLVATLLLGIKCIVDAKSTRMLIMIHEAWRKGGEKEASRILNTLKR